MKEGMEQQNAQEAIEKMEKYVDDLEVRLLKCLNYPKKCK
jgi:hypothetical protein